MSDWTDIDTTIVMVVEQVGEIETSKKLYGIMKDLGAKATHQDIVWRIWALVDRGKLVLSRSLHLVPAPIGGGPQGW
jgi:hypothetical protein